MSAIGVVLPTATCTIVIPVLLWKRRLRDVTYPSCDPQVGDLEQRFLATNPEPLLSYLSHEASLGECFGERFM